MITAAKRFLLSRYVVVGKIRVRSTAAATKKINATESDFIPEIGEVRSFDEIPEVKGLPLIGPLLDYMPWSGFEVTRADKHWTERHKQYGEIYKEKLPGREVVVYCRSPEDTEAMFRSEGKTPNRPYVDALERLKKGVDLPNSIITVNGEEWYKCRRMANSALMTNKMVWKYTKTQREASKDFVTYIKQHMREDGEVPDFADALKNWSFEVSGTFIFSKRLGLLADDAEDEVIKLADNPSTQLEFIAKSLFGVNMWNYFRTKEIKELDKAVEYSVNTMKKIVAREKDNTDNKDSILYKLLNAEDFSEKEKISMIYDIFSASGESTSQAAAFMLYGLTLRSEVQEKLREEILQMSEEDANSGRAVGNLEYVNAFIKETHRMFPLTLAMSRFYDKDIVLSGYNIPAGVRVINTNSATLSRSLKYFSNPNELIPERWMDKENPINKFAVTGPFGQGPRACVGRRLAMQELRLLLIEILKEYRVEYHHKPIVPLFRAVAQPSEPPQFKFVSLRE